MFFEDVFIVERPKLDAVVTWCDTTEEHILKILSTIPSYDAKRIGKRESIKYTLRGLYYNLPWLNNIFLVTNNQWPEFLCEKSCLELSPKIIRVDHKEIHPAQQSMYSAFSIELCINNIKNLTDYFLLVNDDMFAIKPMKISEWLNIQHKGIYRYRTSKIKDYINFRKGYRYWDILRQYQLIQKFYPDTEFIRPSHQIQILHKKTFEIAKEKFPDLYEYTMNIRGRPESDKITRTILEYISLNEKLCVGVSNAPECLYLESNTKDTLENRLNKLQNIQIPPNKKLLCINNIFDLSNIPVLEKLLPHKIPSEK